MFAEHTKASIIALATIDKGVTEAERNYLARVLGGSQPMTSIVRYGEAAKRLHLSVETVKRLVKSGRLHGVCGTGKRACGISEDSLARFCA